MLSLTAYDDNSDSNKSGSSSSDGSPSSDEESSSAGSPEKKATSAGAGAPTGAGKKGKVIIKKPVDPTKGEGDDEDEGDQELPEHLKPIESSDPKLSVASQMQIVAAPDVVVNRTMDPRRHIDPKTKELAYNPKYEELFAPVLGPDNPFKTNQQRAVKNTLAGFVERAHVNEFQFENQRRTFTSYGYAVDPSIDSSAAAVPKVVGSAPGGQQEGEIKTVFETIPKRPKDNRKRDRNDCPEDIEGFLGPWGKYKDEETVSKPNEEEAAELEIILSKRQRRGKNVDDKPIEEKYILHIKNPVDYQGRSFMHPPQDVGVNLKSKEPPTKCFIPKNLIHTFQGHTKGVAVMRWFPGTAHLLLSGGMDSRVKLWEVYNERRCIMTYIGHKQAVRDIAFNNNGSQFLSAGYDRFIKLWDTEKGECISRFTNRKVAYCVKFNPEEDKQHLFVAGTSDKKIVCWDTRSGEVVQEYDRHLGAVNTITFVDDNRRFVSTSDDKSLRVWEWDIPVDMKYIAEPSMHSMPAVTLSPNAKWLACQSMDNKVMIFTAMNRFKLHRKKTFKGHMVAGYACQLDFSPDMSYLISGDADGKIFVWDWKTTKVYSKWKAHENTCISVLWHPHETSKIVSAGWDGQIKLWD